MKKTGVEVHEATVENVEKSMNVDELLGEQVVQRCREPTEKTQSQSPIAKIAELPLVPCQSLRRFVWELCREGWINMLRKGYNSTRTFRPV